LIFSSPSCCRQDADVVERQWLRSWARDSPSSAELVIDAEHLPLPASVSQLPAQKIEKGFLFFQSCDKPAFGTGKLGGQSIGAFRCRPARIPG